MRARNVDAGLRWEEIRALHLQDDPATHAYADILKRLSLDPENAGRKVLLVTSARDGEGKTVTTLHLAAALARRGKTVLVMDANFRRPALGRLLALPDALGLTDLLASGGKPEESVVRDPELEGLHLLPRGSRSDDLLDAASQERLATLVAWARKTHDYVLLDGSATLSSVEPLSMARMADGVVLVVHCDRTQKSEVAAARSAIQRFGGQVVGVVLNRVPAYLPSFYQTT